MKPFITPAALENPWIASHRADREILPFTAQHYSCQTPDRTQIAPPGRALVFKIRIGGVIRAVWGTGYPFAQYVKHAWAGAWVNFIFRNEEAGLSSELIIQAVAATRWAALREPSWEGGRIPEQGIVSFIDAGETRKKRDPGRCYRRAGWRHVGFTKGGLWAFQQLAHEMPDPCAPTTEQLSLFAAPSAGGAA